MKNIETRKKLSKILKGKKRTDETKRKISNAVKGRKLSDETKKKMSLSRKGRIVTKETREKISNALSGIKRTEEFKKKISKSTKGRRPWNKGKRKYSYSDYRKRRNEYQKKYRATIGNLMSKIYKIERKFRIKEFKHLFSNQEWMDKVERTKGICPICGKYVGIENMTLDHIIPLTKAPPKFVYTINDVQPMCNRCNSKKGNRKNG